MYTFEKGAYNLTVYCVVLVVLCTIDVLIAKPTVSGKDEHLALLERLIGSQSMPTPELADRLRQAGPGEKIIEDTDGDGDPDIVTYLDTDPKHTHTPLLVRVTDDDDDMGSDAVGDKDSDCYVADWSADGTADRVVDYWDEDGDGDADRMDVYYKKGYWFKQYLGLVIIKDIGDDDKMWYTENYEYKQRPRCQWRSDFNGNEWFCMYAGDPKTGELFNYFEAPFSHFDTDGDGLAEITVRCASSLSKNTQTVGRVDYLRYSYDVDNDTDWLNRRDYDFSFNCEGPVPVADKYTVAFKLRDGTFTPGCLAWNNVRHVVEAGKWKNCRFAWDEIDNNANILRDYERSHERWEGVGGYWLVEGNKRWEEDNDFSGRMELYYSPVDRRIHLKGAETGYINVDYNHDTTAKNRTLLAKWDAKFLYADTDGDGFFDTWSYDADADDKPERSYKADPQAQPVALRYPDLTQALNAALDSALAENQKLIDAMKLALGPDVHSKAEDWFINRRSTEFYLPDKILWSRESTRYYQDVIREELFTHLLAKIESGDLKLDRATIDAAYARGQFAEVARKICIASNIPMPSDEPWLVVDGTPFAKRIRVRLTNPIDQDRPSTPIVIPIERIRTVAPDFNPACFAVAQTKREILIRQYPSQADDLDGDGKIDEIVFSFNRLASGDKAECFIYYLPEGTWNGNYPKQTQARNKIGIPSVSIGLESELTAFRSYYGKMDLFGKKIECLQLDNLGDYHQESDWGMDVLHLATAPGLGALSLWDGENAYRAYNEEDKQRCQLIQRVLADGPVRSAIGLEIANLKVGEATYNVSVVGSVYADQIYSEQRVRITPASGGSTEAPILSAGLVRIPDAMLSFDPQAGTLCSWGCQDRKIGEIGLTVIAADHATVVDRQTLPDSEEIRLRLSSTGEAKLFVAGEWKKSLTDQRRITAQTAPEWKKQVRRLAERLQHPIAYDIISVETRTNNRDR